MTLFTPVRSTGVVAAVITIFACRAPVGQGEHSESVMSRPLLGPQVHTGTANDVQLGEKLFHDVKLSADSSISCATCHIPAFAFAEPRAISHGIGERSRFRNTPSLINVALQSTFDWDGRAPTLAQQLEGVFSRTGDMGIDLGEAVDRVRKDREYNGMFLSVYQRHVDADGVIAALVAFQQSLVADRSRFDRFVTGEDTSALSLTERRGWQVFTSSQAGCSGCHIPLNPFSAADPRPFSDKRFHNLGVGYFRGRLQDVGRFGVTRRPEDLGAFRTPSLRNVAHTAPYMHDGSLPTLEHVVGFYMKGGIDNPNLDPIMVPRSLSKADSADLIAFLRSLSSPAPNSRRSIR